MSSERRRQFPFDEFEPAWQQRWDELKSWRTPGPGDADFDASKPKFYALDMFPYPSGSGLHVGHPEGYTASDIVSRAKRMRGHNVLHPMGWDAFGLPAEQHAIKTGTHPREETQKNINNFRGQLKRLGFFYDWDREVNTTDPAYFKWTQWIFLQLYHSYVDESTGRARPISELEAQGLSRAEIDARRLAFISEAPVNWCPALGTVLANEEVVDGKSEVGGFPVERRPLRQWMLRITSYAQRLIDDLDMLEWPDSIKALQRNWIGRSEGAEVQFTVAGSGQTITVFTTRPDTLFGATYMVLSPELPLVDEITTPEQKDAVEAYRKSISGKSDRDRAEGKEKTGVFTGAHAVNPVNGAQIPVWIADYVLMGYGTGAIMAVPAHDERDYEFAEKFALPVIQVVQPQDAETDWKGYTDDGTAVNSGFLDGLTTAEAKQKIIAWLEEKGLGTRKINFKLRDWLFSRQRYWGEPFPIVWENGEHRAVPESELPVLPPEMADFKPTGTPEPPLSKATDWVQYSATATRELNTMPQWAGSCWYYLRYCDPKNSERFISKEADDYWMDRNGKAGGVDLYVGGVEHAVLHLLYARFWHKVLYDLGHVTTPEPFQKLVNQGLILGEMEYTVFRDSGGNFVSASDIRGIAEEAGEQGAMLVGVDKKTGKRAEGSRLGEEEVEKSGQNFVLKKWPHITVDARSFKMSKSRGNVVNPDSVIEEYGADSLRLYEMFMGPLEQVKPWSMKGVEGVHRFLARVWRLCCADQDGTWIINPAVKDVAPDKALRKTVHETISKVGEKIDRLEFNTAISDMMVCTNALVGAEVKPLSALADLLRLLSPFAPHVAEELWARLTAAFPHLLAHANPANPNGHLCSHQPWPVFDPAALVADEIEIMVQVNGKLRDRLTVPADTDAAALEAAALASEKVQEHIAGKEIAKIIVVPKRLVNIAVKG